jgi:predicted nucleic acid-binding protein
LIVVDTSVWVAVLNQQDTRQAKRCVELIQEGAPIGLTDVVLAEILQGLRTEREVALVDRHLRQFPILRLETLDDFALAASLYRQARRAGVTIRKTLDCLIAATCVRTNSAILHADSDFDLLASCTPLRVVA